MPIDGSDGRFALEVAQRVEALRRVERSSDKQGYEKRERRERRTPLRASWSEIPHDVVDISSAPSAGHNDSSPPTPHPEVPEILDPERHLDIEV